MTDTSDREATSKSILDDVDDAVLEALVEELHEPLVEEIVTVLQTRLGEMFADSAAEINETQSSLADVVGDHSERLDTLEQRLGELEERDAPEQTDNTNLRGIQ